MEKSLKKHYVIAFWCTLTVAIGLLVGGFFTPPQGEIDGSVLESAGLLFLWPALAFGAKALEENNVVKIQHGNTTISINEAREVLEGGVNDGGTL